MKILIITPRIPYPPFRGDKLKIYNLSKNLSINNTVKILTFIRSKNQLKDLEDFKKSGIKIETVKLTVIQSLFKIFIALFSQKPFQVAWFGSGKMKKKLKEETIKNHYDVIYFHLIRSAQYLLHGQELNKSLKVIDLTDAVSLYLKRFAEITKNPFKRIFVKIEQKRIKTYEKKIEMFDMVFICSNIDKNYLKEQGIKTEIKILNNGIDIDYFNSDSVDYEKNRIIFTGNMPYYANYDAAIYFAKEIFPLINTKISECKFYIVGQKPPRRIKALNSNNIFVTGFVSDIKMEYLRSAVNVAPMRFGAGTLNKVIESIALGIPVVATSIAVEGLPVALKKYVYVADSSEDFAQLVIEILKTPSLRNELWKEGQSIIKEMLSWHSVVHNFENELREGMKKFKVNMK